MTFNRVRRCLCLSAWALVMTASLAQAQSLSARRMAMGGVALTHGGPENAALNVAYRAVPPAPGRPPRAVPLPIGLVPLLSDPPTFDTKDSTFNAFELANLAFHPPWNLPLVEAETPESDIAISVARNSLAIDLGTLREIIPDERVRFSSLARGPALVIGVRRAFVGVAPLIQIQNDFDLNEALRSALREGQPFLPNTEYRLSDQGRAQVAGQFLLGTAFPALRSGAEGSRDGVYVGARGRLLRGIAYADANESVGFTTADTLFSDEPIDTRFAGRMRTAQPGDGRWGRGFDVGAVLVKSGFEIGLAVNDIATKIDWKVKEEVTVQDSSSSDYHTVTVGEGLPFTSTLTATYLITATTRVGSLLVATDLQRDALEQVSGHAGVEAWAGSIALRGGLALDSQQRVQVAGGVGLRLGRIGFDLAVATNQTNLAHERAVDLGAGLAFYSKESK